MNTDNTSNRNPELRRMTRTATFVGVMTMCLTLLVGYFAYSAHRTAELKGIFAENAALAQMMAHYSEIHARSFPRKEALTKLEESWKSMDEEYTGSYFCVVDQQAKLLTNTKRPESIGIDTSAFSIAPKSESGSETLGDLAEKKEDWIGYYTALDGEEQILAVAYVPEIESSIMVHFPLKSVNAEIRSETLPWIIGILLIALVLIPLSLGLFRHAFSRMIAIQTSITAELRKSESTYRLLTDNVRDIIWVMDLELNYTFVSPSIYSLRGYAPEEAAEMGSSVAGPPETFVVLKRCVKELLEAYAKPDFDPDESCMVEVELYRKGGTTFPAEIVYNLLMEDGVPTGVLGVTRDVSERREAEAKLQESEKILLQSQKLEAVGTLAGGIAHDFNNILQSILGYCQVAHKNFRINETLTEDALEEIKRGGTRAAELVEQMLTFSRVSETHFHLSSLHHLIGNSLKFIRGSLPSIVEIRADLDSTCGVVLCDETQIHQVVINLCTNAFHAMEPKGGIVSIRLSEHVLGESQESLSGTLEPGRYAQLVVQDTGSGIDPEVQHRLLDPFFTTKDVGKGTGLGLAMVHGIVKRMEGGLFIESEPGKGTEVRLLLPICTQPVASTKTNPVQLTAPLESGHLLMVDDEKSITGLLKLELQNHGLTVDVFNDPVDALEHCRDHIQQYDYILLDYTMPGMNGIDLAKALAAIDSSKPIYLCTGVIEQPEATVLSESNIMGIIKKPYTVEYLLHTLANPMQPA